MDYIKREDVNRILYDLGVSEVYKLPSFWCHGGKDYQVIPTKYHNGYQQALADADEHIKGIPAADVVEVIRCKDCKYFNLNKWGKVNDIPLIVAHEICDFWGEGCKTDKDGYCSFAERRVAPKEE